MSVKVRRLVLFLTLFLWVKAATTRYQDSVVEFSFQEVTASELQESVDVPIERKGNLDTYLSVRCTTKSGSARGDRDFVERRNIDESAVVFIPGERSKICGVRLIDDVIYESIETFFVHLDHVESSDDDEEGGGGGSPMPPNRPVIGSNDTVLVRILNDEDVPTVQFEHSAYSIREPSSDDHIDVTSMVLSVVRTGDTNTTSSSVRVVTRDGSGTTGLDYHPINKILTFRPQEQVQFVEIEVLHNMEPRFHRTFKVVLLSKDIIDAKLGEMTTATVTILEQESSRSGVLPTSPIVVSLPYYDDVGTKMGSSSSPGYPLVCVTPCDPHFPSYSTTLRMCEGKIDVASMRYAWEVAESAASYSRSSFFSPSSISNTSSADLEFRRLVDSNPFARIDRMVLDSTHFRHGFAVRCVAQPVGEDGKLGVPIKSKETFIDPQHSSCHTSFLGGMPLGFQSQSFVATLKYLGTKQEKTAMRMSHSNRLHVHIEIPHQDGMLPLVSTHALDNLRLVLTDPTYRRQHSCSNLVLPFEKDGILGDGFLKNDMNATFSPEYPYQYDNKLREKETIALYRHLDTKKCLWTFDAYFHMAELLDLCGGYIVSDYQIHGQTTLRVPLYVTYVYASPLRGWTSMEHHTEMEFSFSYNSVLGHSGLRTEGSLGARIQIRRIAIGDSGKIVIDFETKSLFRGMFVKHHPNLPEFESRVVPPSHLLVSFDLALLWTAETFDGPTQSWRAISNYSFKDYTGKYVFELLPCTVTSSQVYMKEITSVCSPHPPQRFEVPIAFQQTNRPVPINYTLNTDFQLLSDEKTFLSDPSTYWDVDFKGTFAKGQTIFGRVLWHPNQDLENVYKLRVERVYICTGRDGYNPTYDPNGEEYGEGPQFGCIKPNKKLKHRIVLLDRKKRQISDSRYALPIEAKFAEDVSNLRVIRNMSGIDGFVVRADGLYNIDGGHQWFLQVVYTIGASDYGGDRRKKRWVTTTTAPSRKNGTNIRNLWLADDYDENIQDAQKFRDPKVSATTSYFPPISIVTSFSIFVIVVLVALIARTSLRRRFLKVGYCRPTCLGVEDKDMVVLFSDRQRCTVKVKVINNGYRDSLNLDNDEGTEV